VEFGDQARITYVMGGLAREFSEPLEALRAVLDAAAQSGMPVDPRVWLDAPPTSSYPACQAVKAAAEQGLDGPYLRVLREGVMCEGRALDTADALVDAARAVPGLDVARFASDLRSSAIVEAFGADVEHFRVVDREQQEAGGERVTLPSFEFRGEDGELHAAYNAAAPTKLRAAALAAGGEPGPLPSVAEALGQGRRLAVPEVAALCDLPGPRASAELWAAAAQWRTRPERFLTGELWSAA